MDKTASPSGRGRGRSRRRRQVVRNVAVASLVLAVLAGGALLWNKQRGDDPKMLLNRASSAFKAEKYAAATVDLRAVLAKDGDNAEARELLGLSYLKLGDANGALSELGKAREQGVETQELALGVVRAQIMLGKFDQARAELVGHGGDESPDWVALSGMLELGQQHFAPARELFKKVLDQHPEHEDARRGLLQVALRQGDVTTARSEIDTLLKASDKDAVLWVIKGALELQDKQLPAAREAFKQALTITAKNPAAILGMTQVLLESGETDAASTQLDALGSQGGDDPRVNFLRARIAEQRKDLDTALQRLKEVLLAAPNDRDALVMGARLSFSMGQFTRAEEYAAQLLQLEPDNEAARRMLGSIQLASGRLDGVSSVLDSEGQGAADTQDPGTLALLGTAYLKRGDYADGEAQLAKAAKLAPDSLPIRTQLALGKLSTGHAEEAIKELKAVLAEQQDFVQAHVMLVLAYLADKRGDDALAAARTLLAIKPDDALPLNVLGFVYESNGAQSEALAAYQQALEKSADFHPARINLARLAFKAKDLAGARKQFQDVLARDEFNASALMGMALLSSEEKKSDEAEKFWQQAREHNPEAVAPRLALARYFREKGNLPRAEEAIREAYKLSSYAPAVQAEYVQIMLSLGEDTEALKAAQALVERAPNSIAALELLARAHNQSGDEPALKADLARIIKLDAEHEAAQILLAQLALRSKDTAAAERIALAMAAQSKNAASGQELLGDLAMQRDNAKAAVEAYTRAFEAAPDSGKVLKLERAERLLGVDKQRLAAWLEAHPDDQRARLAQATTLQEQGAAAAATAAYERMLETRTQDPVVLNNLAWLYFEQKDARALELAKQAYELAPRQAQIVDTYAWILFQQGKREQGLEILKQAAELAPADPDIAFHLASALADSGQQSQALTQLREILKANKQFALRKDAEALEGRLAKK